LFFYKINFISKNFVVNLMLRILKNNCELVFQKMKENEH